MKIPAVLLLFGLPLAAQNVASCPMHKEPGTHQSDVEKHGDVAMGFPHDKTAHHFRLTQEGGAIEVTVREAGDMQNLDAIRMHLKHIATMFAAGNFSIPMFVHSQMPPGVAEMRDRRSDIRYGFEELPTGGIVHIATSNHDVLNAIHDFLVFQIRDHQTGDSERP